MGRRKKEKQILKKLSRKKYTICFVDGTHENFDLLNAYPVTVWNGGKAHKIADNIFHLMRGQIFEIDGLKIFAFGGGESFDRLARKEHESWWLDEMPSPEQLFEGAKNIDRAGCKVDVIVTHEPASRVKGLLKLEETATMKISGLNRYFEDLSQICKFRRWYFGAMHCDHEVPPNQTAVFRKVIRLDENELSPKQALKKPRKLCVPHAPEQKTFKTPHTPLREEQLSEEVTQSLDNSGTEEIHIPKKEIYTKVNQPQKRTHTAEEPKNAPAEKKKTESFDEAEDYTAAYAQITDLINSILAEDEKYKD